MIYGYFDSPEQEEPVYDPGFYVPCPVCDRLLIGKPMKTISLMVENRDGSYDKRSYFYRVHKTCFDNLTTEQKQDLDEPIIAAIVKTKELN